MMMIIIYSHSHQNLYFLQNLPISSINLYFHLNSNIIIHLNLLWCFNNHILFDYHLKDFLIELF